MNAPIDTELISFQGWTLRVRPAAQQPARLLLLVHGWTGDENSMWVFARNLAGDYAIVAPRAPQSTRPSGYSWRALQSDRRELPTLEDLKPPATALIKLVDAYAAELKVDARRFDIMGFSQGAAVCNTLALLHPRRIRRAAILAGFVPAGAESLVEARALEGIPFFVAHGTQDEMVPIDRARTSVQMLERAGARVTFCEDEVGHKVSAGCLHALEAFFV